MYSRVSVGAAREAEVSIKNLRCIISGHATLIIDNVNQKPTHLFDLMGKVGLEVNLKISLIYIIYLS